MTTLVTGDDISIPCTLKKDSATFSIDTGATVNARLISKDHKTSLTSSVTLDHTTSGADWVLVNRGWVPLGERRSQLPAVPGPAERVELHAMIKLPPAKAFGPAAVEDSGTRWPRVIQRLEIAPIGQRLGHPLLPLVLQLDAADPAGFVRDWKPVYGITPDKHRAYAAQWFTLALVLLVIYIGVNTRRRGRDTDGS